MASLDQSRLLALFERDRAALVLYARNWVDESLAADAVQHAFVKLFLLRQSPDEPRAWLFRATRHAAMTLARGEARRRKRERALSLTRDAFADTPAALVDRDAVTRVLTELDESQREVVILRVWAGMTLEQISLVTSMSLPTAHRVYQKSLAAIRAALETTCRTNPK